ncbi:MAG: hypothetical protein FJW30_30290, partial [Acidobacteria bacterium]|nr:hypothetical protein [Acidobacteriota bacterium]
MTDRMSAPWRGQAQNVEKKGCRTGASFASWIGMKRFGCLLVMLAVVLQGAPSARSGRKNDKFAKELNKVNPNDTVR